MSSRSSSQKSRTSLTFLGALRDPENQAAWERFDAAYRPMLVRLGLQLGLDGDGADEVCQRTTIAVHKSLQENKFDPKKGRFKNWVLGIARHQIADLFAEQARQPDTPAQKSHVAAALEVLKDPKTLSSVWDREWHEYVLTTCYQRAKEHFSARDMKVFDLLTVKQMAVAKLAAEMAIRPATIYQIKHRVLKFMGKVKAELESYV